MGDALRWVRSAARALGGPLLGQAISLAIHAGCLGAAAAAVPHLGPTEEILAAASGDPIVYPVTAAGAEIELAARELHPLASGIDASSDGNGASLPDDREGKVGSPGGDTAAGQMANQGPRDNPDPGVSWPGWREYRSCCILGREMDLSGDPDGRISSRDTIGADPQSAAGNAEGPVPADAAGHAGNAAAGSGTGSRALACVPGHGAARGPLQRTYRPGSPRPPSAPSGSGKPAARAVTAGPRTAPQAIVCD